MNEHESGFLRFVESNKAHRLEKLMTSGLKGRAKLRALMANDIRLDSEFASRIPSNQQESDLVYELLVNEGAPDHCYVICEFTDLDGKEMLLKQALDRLVGSNIGAFVSCIPGRLGYYEFDAVKERYLLRRR